MEPTPLENVLNGSAAAAPAPVSSTPAPEPEAPEPQDDDEPTTGDPPAAPPADKKQDVPPEKRAKGLEAGIAAEREKRQAAERRVQELMQQLQSQQQPAAPAQQAAPQRTDDPKPTRADFQTEDEWLDARDEWRDRQRERETQQQAKQKAEAEFQAKTVDALTQAAQMPGFDMDLFRNTPISPVVADAIVDSDAPAKLIHHLVTHPDDARRIAALSPARQIKEIARIEDRLSQPTADEDDDEEDAPAQPARRFPKTLTQARDARGQFHKPGFDGPTPLNAILK